MKESKEVRRNIGTLQGAIVALVAYIVVFTCLAGYGGYFLLQKYEGLQGEVMELRQQIREINQNAKHEDSVSNFAQKKERREVLSSTAEVPNWIKGLAGPAGPAGPAGQPGRDGKDGKDGRDGRDAFSLPAVEKLINKTVTERIEREHSLLMASLPTYGGSVYTRWGRSTCPEDAKLIYHGQMTGPNSNTTGGGTNYQCLPTDPDLAPINAGADQVYNYLMPAYVSSVAKSGPLRHSQHLPCAVCEAKQRVSQVIISGKSRCPSDWNLEYKGYLMSPPTIWANTYRMEYICVDSMPETLSEKRGSITTPWYGPYLHHAAAKCSGTSRINNCPPYKTGQPLLCVVCTK